MDRTIRIRFSDTDVESVLLFLMGSGDWRERVRLIADTAGTLAAEASEPDTRIGRRAALANYFTDILRAERRKARDTNEPATIESATHEPEPAAGQRQFDDRERRHHRRGRHHRAAETARAATVCSSALVSAFDSNCGPATTIYGLSLIGIFGGGDRRRPAQ